MMKLLYVDPRDNVSAQIANIWLDDSKNLTKKVGVFVVTLFPWIIEAALRYTAALALEIPMLVGRLIVQLPTFLILIFADDNLNDRAKAGCIKVQNFFKDYDRFTAIVEGTLYYRENVIVKMFSINEQSRSASACPYSEFPWIMQALYKLNASFSLGQNANNHSRPTAIASSAKKTDFAWLSPATTPLEARDEQPNPGIAAGAGVAPGTGSA